MVVDKWRRRRPQISDTVYVGAIEWVSSIGLDEVLPMVFGDAKAAAYIFDLRKARHIVCIVDSSFDPDDDVDHARLLQEAEAAVGRNFREYGYEMGIGDATAFFENPTQVLN